MARLAEGIHGFDELRPIWNNYGNIDSCLWVETTEEVYWQLLECVPPLYMGQGGFVVGEASTSYAAQGDKPAGQYYNAFLKIGDQYYNFFVKVPYSGNVEQVIKNQLLFVRDQIRGSHG